MSEKAETKCCPQCQSEIPAGAPEGLCPQCLLQAGLESKIVQDEPKTAAYTPSGSGFVPPTPETLQSALPQLEILELLGKGGMGAVYKAKQRGLDRLVAVKILPPEVSQDPAFAERFTREARALAMLNHPHIVGVYDSGHAGGFYYFVMEYVDGVNLRQAMRSGALKSAEALKIVPQICEALQFAHDEGIVHRDIKPENILLDKKGRVKIADFGLAKLLGKTAPTISLTGTRQVMGTMHYMAPEQLEGTRDVDHRADIYSLGVTFYEMLTGELPIGRFAAPSKMVQIDVRLDEVVLRSLEKAPEQRYQQASEIRTDMEGIARVPATSNMSRSAATAKGGIPVSYYFKTLGLAALAWLLPLTLWNAREWGLAAGCFTIGAFIVWRAWRAGQFLPTVAERWRQRSTSARLGITTTFFLFSSFGVYMTFLGSCQAWERMHWNHMARSSAEFKQEYQGAEHQLLRHLPEFAKDIPRAELQLTDAHWSAGWNLSPSSTPSPGFFWTFTICASFLIAVITFVATYLGFLSDDKSMWWGLNWPKHNWASFGLALATLAPVLPYGIILLLTSVTTEGYHGSLQSTAVADRDRPLVMAHLDTWAEENGFVSGDSAAGMLYSVPQGEQLAVIELRHLWRPNVFDRWEMTRHGLQNKAPDLALVLLTSSARSKQTVVVINAKYRERVAEWAEIQQTIETLRHEFATAGNWPER